MIGHRDTSCSAEEQFYLIHSQSILVTLNLPPDAWYPRTSVQNHRGGSSVCPGWVFGKYFPHGRMASAGLQIYFRKMKFLLDSCLAFWTTSLFFFSPQDTRSWILLRSKQFYCCFWNRLNKFSTLGSITSSQFALGFALFIRYTGRTEVLNKKGQISTQPTAFGFHSELTCQSLFFP